MVDWSARMYSGLSGPWTWSAAASERQDKIRHCVCSEGSGRHPRWYAGRAACPQISTHSFGGSARVAESPRRCPWVNRHQTLNAQQVSQLGMSLNRYRTLYMNKYVLFVESPLCGFAMEPFLRKWLAARPWELLIGGLTLKEGSHEHWATTLIVDTLEIAKITSIVLQQQPYQCDVCWMQCWRWGQRRTSNWKYEIISKTVDLRIPLETSVYLLLAHPAYVAISYTV